jgi:lysophospholipase L1-like esterase
MDHKIRRRIKGLASCATIIICCCLLSFVKNEKPVLYLIGDSTVATGSKAGPIQGWGGLLHEYFDTTRISIQNRAVSGTSSRTYITQGVHDKKMLANGMWNGVMLTLKKGDYVIMQFGHNDETPVSDTTRHRGSIKGTGDDTTVVYNQFLGRAETVHTYGWYMRKLISDIKSRGAIPIVCSPIPKNKWADSLIVRSSADYGKWSAEVAREQGAGFIDLNNIAADRYDALGKSKTTASYFVPDNVHTTVNGASLHAYIVASEIRKLKKCPLKDFLIKH